MASARQTHCRLAPTLRLENAFAHARRRDPRGDAVHLALAMLFLATLPLGTAPNAILYAVLAMYAILRAWATAPAYESLFQNRVVLGLLVAWLAWTTLSTVWSEDRVQGRDELAVFRLHIPLLLMIWPVIDRAAWLVRTLGLGVILIAGVQLAQRLAPGFVPEALWWHGEAIPGRYPGMLHPASTAIVAMTAGALAVGEALGGVGRWRTFAWLTLAASIASVFLTGSRGPWIATAVALPLGMLFAASRMGAWRTNPRALALSVVVIASVASALVWTGRDQVAMRWDSARDGFAAALERGDYSSDVAQRLRQFEIALALARENPIAGVGAGAYRHEAREYLFAGTTPSSGAGTAEMNKPTTLPKGSGLLEHAHSAFLHVLATTGVTGFVIFGAVWAAFFRAAVRCSHAWTAPSKPVLAIRAGSTDEQSHGSLDRPDGRDARPTGIAWHTQSLHRAALPGAATGLFIAYAFDSHQLSAPGTTALVFTLALALAPTIAVAERDGNAACESAAANGSAPTP